jgi:transposase
MLDELVGKLEKAEKENAVLRQEKQALEELNRSLASENRSLQSRIDALLRRMFGRHSEKIDPNQTLLFEELFQEAKKAVEEENRPKDEEVEWKWERRRTKPHGRGPLPDHLPRKREEIHPDPADRICPCCGKEMQPIGEEVTEELEYVPCSCYVRQLARIKYGCHDCQEGVAIAPLPPRPIDKGRPGVGLLAHVAVSKYGDHLPLYRQEQIFLRMGIHLRRQVLCDWMGEVAGLLEPIVLEVKRFILAAKVVQSDDTYVQVRRESGQMERGFLWAYSIPWAEVVYDFSLSRGQGTPAKFLEGYRGFLQADGYEGYNEVFRGGLVFHIGCMAHVRRKFYEARFEAIEETRVILVAIQRLYRIEREAKEAGLDPLARREKRQAEALPILKDLEEIIRDCGRHALPKSNLGTAVTYAIHQWPAILRYTEVGEAEIDNNSIENCMRLAVLGRKNWLFLGSAEGGGFRASVLYSLVASCKRLGVEPFAYLRDVLDRVSSHPSSRIWELTPRGWRDTIGRELGHGPPPAPP